MPGVPEPRGWRRRWGLFLSVAVGFLRPQSSRSEHISPPLLSGKSPEAWVLTPGPGRILSNSGGRTPPERAGGAGGSLRARFGSDECGSPGATSAGAGVRSPSCRGQVTGGTLVLGSSFL